MFVFQEPVTTTDIPLAELLSLIETIQPAVCFEEIDLADALKRGAEPGYLTSQDRLAAGPVARVQFVPLEQSVILTANFDLDLARIVERSGYIHSAGSLVFLCEWGFLEVNKVTDCLMRSAVEREARFPLEFYRRSTHGDMVGHLEHLCIDDVRYHFGLEPFQKAADKVRFEYDQRCSAEGLELTGPGHIFICRDSKVMPDRGILDTLYADRANTDFAVCYLSEFKKDNVLHALDSQDEAKPYWAGIFTTPHRLTTAMLNLARVGEGDVVVDPFCHTGTTVIEASHCGATVVAGDKSEPQGANDNYMFLCQGAEKLLSVTDELRRLAGKDEVQNAFNDLANETIKLNGQGLPEVIDGMEIEHLSLLASGRGLDFSRLEQRLFFYLVRRYHMNKLRGIHPEHKDARASVIALCGPSRPTPGAQPKSPISYAELGHALAAYEAAASSSGCPVVKPNPNLFRDHEFRAQRVGQLARPSPNTRFLVGDILGNDDYGLGEGTVDAVVTDPPYGYGEDLSKAQVAGIYRGLFTKSVRWLRHGGRLVFCTLDKVRTGRTEDLLFTEDVLGILNEVVRQAGVVVGHRHLIPVGRWPPFLYYWKSRYALNRAVIAVELHKARL